jgi:hypothetical protein
MASNDRKTGRKWSLPNLGNYPDICLDWVRNGTKILDQNSRCPGLDSNQAPVECKTEALPLELACSVVAPTVIIIIIAGAVIAIFYLPAGLPCK